MSDQKDKLDNANLDKQDLDQKNKQISNKKDNKFPKSV